MKTCTKCGEEKPLDEYYSSKKTKDGRRAACKVCTNSSNREYQSKNKEVLKKKKKKYYEANKEAHSVKRKAYYEANKVEILAKNKEYYEANKVEVLAKNKEYYEANKDKIAEVNKAHYEANKDAYSARYRKYYEANRERIKKQTSEYAKKHREANRPKANAYAANYRTLKRGQTPPNADLELIKQIYDGCPEGYEVDHVDPVARGGLHHQDNLCYLPASENRAKSAKTVDEFGIGRFYLHAIFPDFKTFK